MSFRVAVTYEALSGRGEASQPVREPEALSVKDSDNIHFPESVLLNTIWESGLHKGYALYVIYALIVCGYC